MTRRKILEDIAAFVGYRADILETLDEAEKAFCFWEAVAAKLGCTSTDGAIELERIDALLARSNEPAPEPVPEAPKGSKRTV